MLPVNVGVMRHEKGQLRYGFLRLTGAAEWNGRGAEGGSEAIRALCDDRAMGSTPFASRAQRGAVAGRERGWDGKATNHTTIRTYWAVALTHNGHMTHDMTPAAGSERERPEANRHSEKTYRPAVLKG